MIWHLIITPFVALFNAIYAALPPWNVDLGSSWFHYALLWLVPLDKFIPLHDGFLPLILIAVGLFTVLNGIKIVKFLLSLLPTIGAGG